MNVFHFLKDLDFRLEDTQFSSVCPRVNSGSGDELVEGNRTEN